MKKFVWTLLFVLSLLLFTASAKGVFAANLKFDKSSVSANIGDTFQVSVVVDAGSEEVYSTDAYIQYDKGILEVSSVAEGTFFPTIFNDTSTPSQLYVAGIVDDPATSKTGSGTVATVTFKALSAGSTTLTYFCDLSVSDTSKVVKNDIDSTNIIVCSENGSTTVTVGGAAANPTATPAAAAGGTSTSPTQLPQSGVFDNIVRFAVPGVILLILGGVVKLLL